MKHIILSCLTLLVFSVAAQAQKVQKAIIQVPGAQDEACKVRIEKYLHREYGVTYSNVNFRRHYVTVKWIPDRTNIENIKTAIANIGYDADDIKANPDAYRRLPKICQHVPLTPEPVKDSTRPVKDSTNKK